MKGAGGKECLESTEASKGPSCPICSKPRIEKYSPFCSKRCADVDLGRWLKGNYAIPVTPDSDEDGDDADLRPQASAPNADGTAD